MDWVEEKLAALKPAGYADSRRAWERLRARQRSRRQRLIVAGGAFTAIAAASAFPPSRAMAKRCVEACGEILGLRGDTPLRNLQSVDLRALRGQVVLLNFWATWCPPCEAEIPWFVEMQKEMGERGLTVVGVCMDENAEALPAFLRRKGVNYRVVHDNRFAGVQALPATFLLDRAGNVAFVHEGLVAKETYLREVNERPVAK